MVHLMEYLKHGTTYVKLDDLFVGISLIREDTIILSSSVVD